MNFYDSRGLKVELGEVLGRGGEGEIFALNGQLAAKVFHPHLAQRKAPKIAAMVKTQSPALLKVAAWPVDTLHAEGGAVVGAVMPRVRSHWDIHELYTPQSRRVHFPRADWRFLLRVAANVARAFAVVHQAGHVVGDINFRNVVVYRDTTVTLLDCDSFQIEHDGERYLCEVGVPEFTPPELLSNGQQAMACPRTFSHDNFGLAVLIFHLLFLGRHPFTGIHTGAGEMSPVQAIQERRFAYGEGAAARRMRPPPGALALESVPSLQKMFEDAFLLNDRCRPGAAEWMSALESLVGGKKGDAGRLKCCAHSKSHYFPAELSSCPWCELENRTRFPVFGFSVPSSGLSVRAAFEVARKVPPPPETFSVPQSRVSELLVKQGAWKRFEDERRKLVSLQKKCAPRAAVSGRGPDIGPATDYGAVLKFLYGLLCLVGIAISLVMPPAVWSVGSTTVSSVVFGLILVFAGVMLLLIHQIRRMLRGAQCAGGSGGAGPSGSGSDGDITLEVMAGLERLLIVREEIMRARDNLSMPVEPSHSD